MNDPKFQIYKSPANGEYFYRLRAANGRIILNGEGHTTKQNCQKSITSVKENAPLDNRYDRKNAPGNYTFNLKAANGEIIGRSENYTSETARENGIESVKGNAPDAPVEDLT